MHALRKFALPVLVATFVGSAAVLHADLWSDLGTREAEARDLTVQSVLNGSVPWIGAQAFKAATPAVRVALVQRTAAWAKTFIQSPAFKTLYDTARGTERPQAPKAADGSFADQLKKQRDDFEKSAAEMRKNAAGQSQQVRDMVEKTITTMRAQLDAMSKNTDYVKTMEKASAQSAVDAQARYTKELQAFDRDHPPSPQSAVALRLHHFIDVCGTVDFSAQLVSSGGAKVFANPAYEQKSPEWKMCFRAGREPVEAAKTLATAWLKEIGG